ncbi:MAG: acyltransferase family protein [Planctomycetota bacterium]
MREPRESPTGAQPARWLGLDALRGLTIAAMILVNNPGRWSKDWQYGPLRHADWHGCTFTDLVFPTFLFCAGVAIVPALSGRLERGSARAPIVRGILARVVKLVLLGMFLSAFPLLSFAGAGDGLAGLFEPLLSVRIPGVLQRIGVCYGLAALLFVFTTQRTQRWVLWGCLLLHWALITLVAVPGFGAPDLGDPAGTLQGWLDRAVFGSHIYKPNYDPEGLLSTMPALASCLFGVEAGRLLRLSSRSSPAPSSPAPAAAAGDGQGAGSAELHLLRCGGLLMALGAVWGWFLPVNKYLWTSSYAVWTAGVATLGLGLLVYVLEQPGAERRRRFAYPLQVYGTNALLVFVGSGLLGRTIASLVTVPNGDGRSVPLKSWLFDGAFASWAPPRLASLMFAVAWILVWYVVLRALYRRGVIWKV